MLEQLNIWMNFNLKECVPLETVHRSSLSPWVSRVLPNQEVKTVKQQQQRYPNLCLKLKTSRLEKQITSMIESYQQVYETNLANNLSTKPLFKYFKPLRSGSQIPLIVRYRTITADMLGDQGNLFNAYFQSIFSPLVAQIVVCK